MFFVLSKIFWAVVSPLNLVFLLMLGGMALSAFSRLVGRSVMVLGMALFIVTGLLPTGRHMLAALENDYSRPASMPGRVDGILVLGGSSDTDVSQARGVVALNDSAERLFTGMELARQYPNAILVFSGGNGHLLARGQTESDDVDMLMRDQQFSEDNVIFENLSRNTYQNFILSKKLVLPQPEETWLLVTSAFHMPRAMAVARATGWTTITPYPVDYRTTGRESWWPDRFNMLGNMYDFNVALHEYIGLAAYQLSGKISLPSP